MGDNHRSYYNLPALRSAWHRILIQKVQGILKRHALDQMKWTQLYLLLCYHAFIKITYGKNGKKNHCYYVLLHVNTWNAWKNSHIFMSFVNVN